MRKIVVACYVLLAWPLTTICQTYSLTVFGTDVLSAARVRESWSSELEQLLELYQNDRTNYALKRKELNDQLHDPEKFSYTNTYLFKSYSGNFSFIIDVVENEDSARRMSFRKPEVKSLTDPDSLIAKWKEYEGLSYSLFKAGEISDMSCPVIHCTWSFYHPKLMGFLSHFEKYAPENKELLVEIFNHSDSASWRASAAFLLAHAGIENDKLLQIEMSGINDNESVVRNNAMRVIYYIARAFPESDIDVSRIIEVLDYPTFTDRNKALVVLRSLPLNNLSQVNLQRLLPILLEILEKKDAHNYSNAHRVLKKISQKEFSADETGKWRDWATRLMSK